MDVKRTGKSPDACHSHPHCAVHRTVATRNALIHIHIRGCDTLRHAGWVMYKYLPAPVFAGLRTPAYPGPPACCVRDPPTSHINSLIRLKNL